MPAMIPDNHGARDQTPGQASCTHLCRVDALARVARNGLPCPRVDRRAFDSVSPDRSKLHCPVRPQGGRYAQLRQTNCGKGRCSFGRVQMVGDRAYRSNGWPSRKKRFGLFSLHATPACRHAGYHGVFTMAPRQHRRPRMLPPTAKIRAIHGQ